MGLREIKIKEKTFRECKVCGSYFTVIYVKGGLADYCFNCEFEEKHKRRSNSEFIMPIGKHKGKTISELPIEYLEWGAQNIIQKNIKARFVDELSSRRKAQKVVR